MTITISYKKGNEFRLKKWEANSYTELFEKEFTEAGYLKTFEEFYQEILEEIEDEIDGLFKTRTERSLFMQLSETKKREIVREPFNIDTTDNVVFNRKYGFPKGLIAPQEALKDRESLCKWFIREKLSKNLSKYSDYSHYSVTESQEN
ncbi:hypothetical protein BKH41_03685 [Helicobacter sp. 12S02232-10]|uniref:hypothetical protein n=1 Tax=Helicobacter sp. 12S02232-10 TaxID=1476197 RepID=UPI000BA59A16|nr:hypothetical protein [Helicobacter sp. 12S02232-10]PAF49194.1 hypothetical protein BKH41_03685 [Helicobacter sp. 12S02232-10]